MHRNARLTPAGRLLLCERIAAGWPVARAAESMGISRDRAYVWWRRYQAEGLAGLEDRPSRPHRTPTRTKASTERRIATSAPAEPSPKHARPPSRPDERVTRQRGHWPRPRRITAGWKRSSARPAPGTAGD